MTYDYLVLALGAEVNFFGVTVRPSGRSRMNTLADAVRLKDPCSSAGDRRPQARARRRTGRSTCVVVGGGPTGVETAGPMAELCTATSARTTPTCRPDKARVVLVEAAPEIFAMFKPDIRSYTAKALEERGVEVMTGEVVETVTPERVTLKSGDYASRPHARLGRRACRATRSIRSLGLELERGNRIAVDSDCGSLRIPRCTRSATSLLSRTRRRSRCSRGWARLRCSRASTPVRRSREWSKGKEAKPFRYRDKGTMATIGRGRPWCRCSAGTR